MNTRTRDGAACIGLLLCLSVALVTPTGADEFRPELAFGGSSIALEGTLANVRGKGSEDPVMNQLLSATLAGNSSVNMGTSAASNAILDNSFANANGFLTVIQNAADNVIIQSSTSLTVNFHP